MLRVLLALFALTSALPAHKRTHAARHHRRSHSIMENEEALTAELQRVGKLHTEGILSDDEWQLERNASVARHRDTSLARLLQPHIAEALEHVRRFPSHTYSMPPYHVRFPDSERRDVDTAGDNINVAMAGAPVGAISASLNGKNAEYNQPKTTKIKVFSQHAGCPDAQCPRAMINNIGYMSRGFNIYYASPYPKEFGVDPGFTTFAGADVFQMTYIDDKSADYDEKNKDKVLCEGANHKCKGRETFDGRSEIPDSVNVVAENGCTISFDMTTLSTTSSLETFTSESYGGSGEIGYSAVSGGGGYSKETSEMKTFVGTNDQTVIVQDASCATYRAALNEYTLPPRISPELKAAVAKIEAVRAGSGEDKAAQETRLWYDLFDQFGTHFIKELTLGSSYRIVETMAKSTFKTSTLTSIASETKASMTVDMAKTKMNRRQKKINSLSKKCRHPEKEGPDCDDKVTFALSELIDTLKAEAKLEVGVAVGNKDVTGSASSNTHEMTSKRSIVIGAPPTEDTMEWAKQTFDEQMPLRYALRPICEVFGKIAAAKASCTDWAKLKTKLYEATKCPAKEVELSTVGNDASRAACWEHWRANSYCKERVAKREGFDVCMGNSGPTRPQHNCNEDKDCQAGGGQSFQCVLEGDIPEDQPFGIGNKRKEGGEDKRKGVCKVGYTRVQEMKLVSGATPVCPDNFVSVKVVKSDGTAVTDSKGNMVEVDLSEEDETSKTLLCMSKRHAAKHRNSKKPVCQVVLTNFEKLVPEKIKTAYPDGFKLLSTDGKGKDGPQFSGIVATTSKQTMTETDPEMCADLNVYNGAAKQRVQPVRKGRGSPCERGQKVEGAWCTDHSLAWTVKKSAAECAKLDCDQPTDNVCIGPRCPSMVEQQQKCKDACKEDSVIANSAWYLQPKSENKHACVCKAESKDEEAVVVMTPHPKEGNTFQQDKDFAGSIWYRQLPNKDKPKILFGAAPTQKDPDGVLDWNKNPDWARCCVRCGGNATDPWVTDPSKCNSKYNGKSKLWRAKVNLPRLVSKFDGTAVWERDVYKDEGEAFSIDTKVSVCDNTQTVKEDAGSIKDTTILVSKDNKQVDAWNCDPDKWPVPKHSVLQRAAYVSGCQLDGSAQYNGCYNEGRAAWCYKRKTVTTTISDGNIKSAGGTPRYLFADHGSCENYFSSATTQAFECERKKGATVHHTCDVSEWAKPASLGFTGGSVVDASGALALSDMMSDKQRVCVDKNDMGEIDTDESGYCNCATYSVSKKDQQDAGGVHDNASPTSSFQGTMFMCGHKATTCADYCAAKTIIPAVVDVVGVKNAKGKCPTGYQLVQSNDGKPNNLNSDGHVSSKSSAADDTAENGNLFLCQSFAVNGKGLTTTAGINLAKGMSDPSVAVKEEQEAFALKGQGYAKDLSSLKNFETPTNNVPTQLSGLK